MQGSWRPVMQISAFSSVSRSTVRWARAMEGVGLTAARNQSGMPSVMPPKMPPQRFVSVTILPFSTAKASLFSLPRSAAAAKPAPNSMPLTAGMPNTAAAMRFSMPPNIGSPSPAGSPSTAHSMMPPTLSPSARAAAMAARICSPRASLTTGKGFSAVESVSAPSSATSAMAAMRLMTAMPSRDKSWRQIPPAMQSGAVSLPEKCPPPAASCAPKYFTSAV